MPCLDEESTVGRCVEEALGALARAGLDGEVVVADNGSRDASRERAAAAGARVVPVAVRGYGIALRAGIETAAGEYVVMGDSDATYDFGDLAAFVRALDERADLVLGNRFRGGIERGAMPPLHRYFGNPLLTWLARLFFGLPVGDVYCGLRAFRRDPVRRLGLRCEGMEYALEMLIKARRNGLVIREVPTRLRRGELGRASHLRSWRDGRRSLRLYLLSVPAWLFRIPGIACMLAGAAGMAATSTRPLEIGGIELGVHTLLYSALAVLVGLQALAFDFFAGVGAVRLGLLPDEHRSARALRQFRLEHGVVAGALLGAAGVVATVLAVLRWRDTGFSSLDPARMMRLVIPAATSIALGAQLVIASCYACVLKHSGTPDAGPGPGAGPPE